MNAQETLYAMALSRAPRINLINQRLLVNALGSATAVFEHRHHILDALPDASPALAEALAGLDTLLPRAEEELEFAQKSHIQCLGINDDAYPSRLRECPDAPILLYYLGQANLNRLQVISVVGTRHITEYGKDLCRDFIRDLSQLCPDTLVVSGLAYGVDVHIHRAALDNGMHTAGVLAHGLDQIYPRMHKQTAAQMVQQGGLITEFMSRTNADKRNFVQRNRIVAGLSDAVVVVESAYKGGSLITAEIADSYHREVFSFPGRTKDPYSAGCNQLIRSHKAQLITCAEELVQALGWVQEEKRRKDLKNGIQQQLFPDLNEDEQKVVRSLQGSDSKQINIIAIETGIPIGMLSSILFTLEMKGIIKMMNGGTYRLL